VRRQGKEVSGLGSGIWGLINHSLLTSTATMGEVADDVRRQGKEISGLGSGIWGLINHSLLTSTATMGG